jgi:acetyl-CoA carboxylase biotin carboxylase subunit
VHVGPAPSAQSYLNGDQIIAAARSVGAVSIHPGFGFLSEREWFVKLVRDSGLAWIGPPPEAIAAMGSKTEARRLAMAAGVPVVPGTTEPLRDLADARATAERFGYPVLLKAAAGGGGKGMRVVRAENDLADALAAAQREAKNAFGDDAVYVEKYIEGPRHVEIQVLADQYGRTISLGERECSIQRRHQKMIEEAPSVAVNPELRRRMGATAVAAARAAGYVNAGTCEFLLDQKGEFYFLEMNTRLQVEHPVTENVTGVDLVQWQIRIAAGERLDLPDDIEPQGWSIECRITSEDPANGFLPSTGRVSFMHLPAGPGVRWDGGIEPGSVVGLHYDSLLGKLIVRAPNRPQAIARMKRALHELRIVGVETSREFHLRVMDDADYARGDVNIQWLEQRLPELAGAPAPAGELRLAALAGAMLAERDRGRQTPGQVSPAPGPAPDRWREAARLDTLR